MIMFQQNVFAKVSVKECNEWKKTEKQFTSNLPRKIGPGTELTNFMINCDTKVIKYTKRLLIDVKLFKDGWMKRKQRQHINLHCNKNGIASTIKWNVMDDLFDKDFNYITTFITKPSDCL